MGLEFGFEDIIPAYIYLGSWKKKKIPRVACLVRWGVTNWYQSRNLDIRGSRTLITFGLKERSYKYEDLGSLEVRNACGI